MSETLFIVCVSIVLAVAVLLAVWLIISLIRRKKHVEEVKVVSVDGEEYYLVPLGEKAPERPAAQASPAPAQAPVQTSAEPESEAAAALADGAVLLRRSSALPYPQAYAALSGAQKKLVDAVLAHAESKSGCKTVVNEHAACVYFGKKQLVRVLLRRGRIIARMQVQNNALCAYADENDFDIREKPVDVRVEDARTMEHIKGMIDINYATFTEERAAKEQKQKEERAKRRQAKRLAAAANKQH